MRSQRMPVGDKKVTVIFVLEFDPVLQHTVVVPEVQTPGGAHTGQNTVFGFAGQLRSTPHQGIQY